MALYLISFNQQWVGDHPPDWFEQHGRLALAVVEEMRQSGVLVLAGGLDEQISRAFTAAPTGDSVLFSQGPYHPGTEFIGGLTVVDVVDEQAARLWAGRLAEACGWPQEVRLFMGSLLPD